MSDPLTEATTERDRITAIIDAHIEEFEAASKVEELSPRLREEFAAMAVGVRILRKKVIS